MNPLRSLFGPPSRERFAKLVLASLRAAGETASVELNADEFRLEVTGGNTGDHQLWLGNVYQHYCAAPKGDRPEVVRRFVRAFTAGNDTTDKSFEEVRSSLLPRVRDRGYYHVTAAHTKLGFGKEVLFPHKPVGEFLAVSLGVDYPDHIAEVGPDTLEKWGVTFEEALGVAVDNLWKASNERFEKLLPGLYASRYRDNYDASRLLLVNQVRSLGVTGDPVATVPNRDTLFVTGENDAAGLEGLAKLTEEAFKEPRPMTTRPVVLRTSGWEPFTVPEGHPAFVAVKRLEYVGLANEYADQKATLDKLHEQEKKDVFVAKFQVFQKDGVLRSLVVWGDVITDALLPEADAVAFVVSNGDEDAKVLGEVPWENVTRVVPELLEPTSWYPPRYRVTQFPAPEAIKALGLTSH